VRDWINIEYEGLPNFCIHGFHTDRKVRFKAGDGEHVGIYHGWGGFADEKKLGLEHIYDAGFEGDKKVTHWMPIAKKTRNYRAQESKKVKKSDT